MTTRHEPREGFAERLEWQIATEVRRRTREAEAPGWMPRSPRRLAFAAGLLVIASMAVGGAAVAAAYQAKANEQRDLIAAAIELRLNVAQQRLEAAKAERAEIQKRVATGMETQEALLISTQKITEAEADIATLRLQVEEVRVTGREPRPEITAPVVPGRDFVALRLESEISVASGVHGLERTRLQAWQRRFDVGLADAMDVAAAQARLVEIEAALTALRQKLETRRRFTSGVITATLADLRVLEVEAEQRVLALGPKLQLARNLLQQVVTRAEIGTSTPVDVAQARLRVAEIEADLYKAQLDLTLIRKRKDEAR